MAFCLGNGIWGSVFAVPNAIADTHLKIASGLSIKVLLLLLRHGGRMELQEITGCLGQSPTDIQDALNYWIQAGVIASEEPPPQTPQLEWEEAASPMEEAQPATPESGAHKRDETAPRRVSVVTNSRRRLTTQAINEMAQEDRNIEYLLQEAQAVLGKALTPVSTDTVVALYSYHGMQPDLILMLLHYCVSIGKDNMRYIEKMAADWLDKGIDTHERAEEEILRLTRRNTAEGKVKSAFGIHDRSLTSGEKKYIQTWLEEYRMDLPLIQLAYERTVELKGRISFPYINGILTNWYKKGIDTPARAMGEIREKGEAPKTGSSYDMDELERMITYEDIV